jgi:hypothetical protein
MASESDARYTFLCPKDHDPTFVYSRAYHDRCEPGVTMRMRNCPVCHKPHVFTKQDLVRSDRGRGRT